MFSFETGKTGKLLPLVIQNFFILVAFEILRNKVKLFGHDRNLIPIVLSGIHSFTQSGIYRLQLMTS